MENHHEVTQEMKDWLNPKVDDMEKEGSLIFSNFKKKFNLEYDEARCIIHCWDAQRRDIPNCKMPKN